MNIMLLHYITNHTTQQMKKSLSLLEMVVSLLVMSVIVATSLKYGSSAYSQYKYSANQKKYVFV